VVPSVAGILRDTCKGVLHRHSLMQLLLHLVRLPVLSEADVAHQRYAMCYMIVCAVRCCARAPRC